MERREFLRYLMIGAAGSTIYPAGLTARSSRQQSSRPNIIVVFADQMRSQVLGCYGSQQVRTPHFDHLASEGVRFTNALSSYPVCSPFRAMLMTGQYPMANGTVYNDVALKDGLPTIAKVCKENGYATGYIGKWHLEWHRNPFVPKTRRQGFDYWAVRNCSHDHFDSFYCSDSPQRTPLQGYEPEAQTQLAAEYIQHNRNEPFCLFMSWGPPHPPYKAPESYAQKYPKSEISFRSNVWERRIVDELIMDDSVRVSADEAAQRAHRREIVEDEHRLRTVIREYYAATEALDDSMGRLMEAIDQAGIRENTILLFTSDHGDMLGSHRMISKQAPHEESISIPFLLRFPKRIPAGITTDALLSPIDIMPTLLDLAGLPCPDSVDGKAFTEAALGERSDQRDAVLLMKMYPGGNPYKVNAIREWRGVRTKRYTYARLVHSGPWILYDNAADPYQMRNLIDHPLYAEVRLRLEHTMKRLLEEANDPVDPEKIIEYKERRKSNHNKG